MNTDRPEKLPALTSLRFFGAAMVVLAHTAGAFGTFPTADNAAQWTLSLGVTFFYVLSGFILTYVYPDPKASGLRTFWLARAARIWPAHLAAFALLLIIVPRADWTPAWTAGLDTVAANALLVHSWLPIQRYTYSYNAVSWSLSVELAFYLLFPFLLGVVRNRWYVALIATFALSLALAFAATNHLLPMPQGWAAGDLAARTPWPRLVEFVAGIATAVVWRQVQPRIRLGTGVATALEVGAVALAVWVVHFAATGLTGVGNTPWAGYPVRTSLVNALAAVVFAVLVFVMALRSGALSRLLAARPLVLLGEVSYSIYLLHFVLLVAYRAHPEVSRGLTAVQTALAYWAVVILASFSVWVLIETPARLWLVRQWPRGPRQTASAPRRSFRSPLLPAGVAVAVAVVTLVGVACYRGAPPSLLGLPAKPFDMQVDFRANQTGGMHLGQPIVVERDKAPADGIIVDGWVFDVQSAALARGVYISVNGTADFPAAYGVTRPDLVTHFSDERYLQAGFSGRVPLEALPRGEHRLTVKVVDAGGAAYAETPAIVLIVQ